MPTQNILKNFIQDIIDTLPALNLKNPKIVEEKLKKEAQVRIGAMALKELGRKKTKCFFALSKTKPDPEELLKFFQENIQEFQEKIDQELGVLKKEFLANLNTSKKP